MKDGSREQTASCNVAEHGEESKALNDVNEKTFSSAQRTLLNFKHSKTY
jgi:hypothetical protein